MTTETAKPTDLNPAAILGDTSASGGAREPVIENTEHARITALETQVAELLKAMANRDEFLQAVKDDLAKINADLAMIGDRPALDAVPLEPREIGHVRAVLARFSADAPPNAR